MTFDHFDYCMEPTEDYRQDQWIEDQLKQGFKVCQNCLTVYSWQKRCPRCECTEAFLPPPREYSAVFDGKALPGQA